MTATARHSGSLAKCNVQSLCLLRRQTGIRGKTDGFVCRITLTSLPTMCLHLSCDEGLGTSRRGWLQAHNGRKTSVRAGQGNRSRPRAAPKASAIPCARFGWCAASSRCRRSMRSSFDVRRNGLGTSSRSVFDGPQVELSFHAQRRPPLRRCIEGALEVQWKRPPGRSDLERLSNCRDRSSCAASTSSIRRCGTTRPAAT